MNIKNIKTSVNEGSQTFLHGNSSQTFLHGESSTIFQASIWFPVSECVGNLCDLNFFWFKKDKISTYVHQPNKYNMYNSPCEF